MFVISCLLTYSTASILPSPRNRTLFLVHHLRYHGQSFTLPVSKARVAQQPKHADSRRLPSRRTRSFTPFLDNHRQQSHLMRNAQFSLGFFFFIDASTFSHSRKNGSEVHIKFVDWIPGICSAFGMLVINSIEKTRLSADSYSYSGAGVAWKARTVLFLGFALMAGGLAGSVVSTRRLDSILRESR